MGKVTEVEKQESNVKSKCGTYTWDGQTVRLSCGTTTLLPWSWVENMGGGWKGDQK